MPRLFILIMWHFLNCYVVLTLVHGVELYAELHISQCHVLQVIDLLSDATMQVMDECSTNVGPKLPKVGCHGHGADRRVDRGHHASPSTERGHGESGP